MKPEALFREHWSNAQKTENRLFLLSATILITEKLLERVSFSPGAPSSLLPLSFECQYQKNLSQHMFR